MHSDIRKNTKRLLVISDTAMQYTKDGIIAFGPVVKELSYLLREFDNITWIGFHKTKKNNSLIPIKNPKITSILIPSVGGKRYLDKIRILASYPRMMKIILSEVRKHDYIHSRAPSNPAAIAMFLSLFFSKKQFWHKYGGSWIDRAPFFYNFQRLFLRILNQNSKITINGDYCLSNSNIIPFENPCLDNYDRENGKKVLKTKTTNTSLNFCFVGGLNHNKGVNVILESLKEIDFDWIGQVHFVGDGPKRFEFEETAKNINTKITFHGFLEKDAISSIYSICDFIILPSKSEGFPKVIGEAMNYGCIPIVSDVSCISKYIQDGSNGFLINPITSEEVRKKINLAKKLSNEEIIKMNKYNFELAEKFTYEYYNNRIINEIFEIKEQMI